MESTKNLNQYLTSLSVFENTLNKELVRSLHVYRVDNGKENLVEKEFLFRKKGMYVETVANPFLKLQGFNVSELFEGQVLGLWLCIFAFHVDRLRSIHIPQILLISRNPKLKWIPELANDLQMVYQLSYKVNDQNPSNEKHDEMDTNHQQQSEDNPPTFGIDLNSCSGSVAPCEHSETQPIEQSSPDDISQSQSTGEVEANTVKKRKRAASKDVANIELNDLVKCFDRPIVEASTILNIGVTVLKKKCREFGIPRWPHRKIKSLDSLIHELQEASQLQEVDQTTSIAIEKRRKILEEEKETIQREPFMEIQTEIKKFRQDIFKRRHKARALNNKAHHGHG